MSDELGREVAELHQLQGRIAKLRRLLDDARQQQVPLPRALMMRTRRQSPPPPRRRQAAAGALVHARCQTVIGYVNNICESVNHQNK